MKTLDLTKAVRDAITLLEDRGKPASASAVLKTLGVALPPTLRRGDPAAAPTRRAPNTRGPNEGAPTAPPDGPGAGSPVSLGRFQFHSELGRGGLGGLIEARDPELRRSVAVKMFPGEARVPLYSDAEIGAGLVYVPPGPFIQGGDPEAQEGFPRSKPWVAGFFISMLPVTMQDCCDFLNGLHGQDPEAAWAGVPRQESGLKSNGGQYWDRPAPGAPYRVPDLDRDGDRWDPCWPVSAISWDDTMAYVRWRSARDGVCWLLPDEGQWEKAARGVDGHIFPWGNGFDPQLCKTRNSRPGRPQPEAVGSFPTDISPFGVRDLAGGMREWCGDATYGGDPERRPVRGGSWDTLAPVCRAVSRRGGEPWFVHTRIGARLVRAAPSRVPG